MWDAESANSRGYQLKKKFEQMSQNFPVKEFVTEIIITGRGRIHILFKKELFYIYYIYDSDILITVAHRFFRFIATTRLRPDLVSVGWSSYHSSCEWTGRKVDGWFGLAELASEVITFNTNGFLFFGNSETMGILHWIQNWTRKHWENHWGEWDTKALTISVMYRVLKFLEVNGTFWRTVQVTG